jgi:hypothetical protein
VVTGGGVRRSKSTGLVVGFKAGEPLRRAAGSLLCLSLAAVTKRRRVLPPFHKGRKVLNSWQQFTWM